MVLVTMQISFWQWCTQEGAGGTPPPLGTEKEKKRKEEKEKRKEKGKKEKKKGKREKKLRKIN